MDKFPPLSPAMVKSSSKSNPSSVVTRELKEELGATKEPLISEEICAEPLITPSPLYEPLIADLKVESVKSIANVLVEAIVPPPVNPVPAVTETEEWSICSLATKPLRLS